MAITCPQCGTKVFYKGANFCPECGTRLDGEAGPDGPDHDTEAVSRKDQLVRSLAGTRASETLHTDRLSFDPKKIPFGPSKFDADVTVEMARFLRLPEKVDEEAADKPVAVWRVLLISANRDIKPLGLEIRGEVIVGRKTVGADPDLDLTQHGGIQLGVSRRHALLRPSESELLIVDLVSRNGTFCNGSKLDSGMPRALHDLDVLSFGGVHFLVKFVNQPGAKSNR